MKGMVIEMKQALEYHLEQLLKAGYQKDEILGVFVYGSQNYNYAHADSDVDTKAIIIPSWNRLVHEPILTKEHHWENGEHCEVKDIREFVKMLYKQNVNFLEVLFTDYALVNSAFKNFYEERILTLREKIVRYDVHYGIASICGQAIHTLHQAEIRPVWGEADKKYGNALRLMKYLKHYVANDIDYKSSITLTDEERADLIGYKTGTKTASKEEIYKLKMEFFEFKENNAPTDRDEELKRDLDNAVSDFIWLKVLKDREGYGEIDFS